MRFFFMTTAVVPTRTQYRFIQRTHVVNNFQPGLSKNSYLLEWLAMSGRITLRLKRLREGGFTSVQTCRISQIPKTQTGVKRQKSVRTKTEAGTV